MNHFCIQGSISKHTSFESRLQVKRERSPFFNSFSTDNATSSNAKLNQYSSSFRPPEKKATSSTNVYKFPTTRPKLPNTIASSTRPMGNAAEPSLSPVKSKIVPSTSTGSIKPGNKTKRSS